MKKIKICSLAIFIFCFIISFKMEAMGSSEYMKIVLKNGQVFYGKIYNECSEGDRENNEVMVEIGSTIINFKRREIESIVNVYSQGHMETVEYKKEEKNKSAKRDLTKGGNVIVAKFSSIVEKERDSIDKFIKSLGKKYEIDPDLIKAIIKAESNFDRFATSSKGAKGLMQLMPETAQIFGVFDAYNPYQNIEGGVRYFRRQLNEFDEDIRLALAAYNAGPEAVKKYKKVPPFKETRRFVKKVLFLYDYFKNDEIIVIPKKNIYAFKDKRGDFIITDVSPEEIIE